MKGSKDNAQASADDRNGNVSNTQKAVAASDGAN